MTTPHEISRSPHWTKAYLSMLLAPLVAFGQGTPSTTTVKPEEVVELEAYTVSGVRAGLETAIETKRTATITMDSISSEDIGKFPDQNIAESLQRVSGVMIERSRGEGSRVSVRGLDPKFNSIKYNGRTLTSASSYGRDFNFILLQPEFIGSLEVYKSASADIEEGGVSATINVRTLRPLDIGQRRIVLNVEQAYEENAEKWSPRAMGIFSDTFADGKAGLLIGLGYNKRQAEGHTFAAFGFENGNEKSKNLDYNRDGDLDDTVRFNHGMYFNAPKLTRERWNTVATLQFKPNDRLELYVDGLFAQLKNIGFNPDNALRFTYILPNVPTAIKGSAIEQINNENYATMLDADGIDHRNNNRVGNSEERTYTVAGGFKFAATDRLKFEGEAAQADSRQLSTSVGLEIIGRANAKYDTRGDRGGIPTVTFERGYNPLNPANFQALGFNGAVDAPNTDKSTDLRLDGHFQADWGIIKSIDFGTKYTKRKHYRTYQGISISAQKMAELTGSVYNPNSIEGGSFDATPFMDVYGPSTDFLSAASGNFDAMSRWLAYSQDKLYSKISLDKLIAAVPLDNNPASSQKVDEDVLAAYVKANFKGKIGSIPFSGNVGVRVARTDQLSDGYAPDFSQIVFSQQGATTIVPIRTLAIVERSYTDVLPSLNLLFNLNDTLDLRFAAARVMSRPDLGILSTGTSINANVLSINSNNPNVEPFRADQYDLSFEKYMGRGGLVTVAGFLKKIESFYESKVTRETYNVKLEQGTGTIPLTFSHFFPDNGAGTDLSGVELGYQQQFTFLPKPFDGFGVVLNYTYVDSGSITPVAGGPALQLTGLSRHNYNAIAYYENKRFSLRFAYNFRDKFLVNPTSHFGDGDNTNAFRTLDATLSFNIAQNYTLSLHAANLTDEYRSTSTNYGFLRELEDNGRRFTVSLRASF